MTRTTTMSVMLGEATDRPTADASSAPEGHAGQPRRRTVRVGLPMVAAERQDHAFAAKPAELG
ncbi:hypothetical protein I551_4448 [Mycobacterium ulcerans str. Harvey]|uniref:Uncharacterized protein n=1 Tax=Mycobacterium ulcerans str. Harvey TaxID=1299332 RepID=A0ABN0QWJ6_MYCUL|nr:hypothetical protein I551_4448 [Mycobacterium ulcerans str. Harvey]